MRSTVWGPAMAVLGCSCAEAALFGRTVSGKGYLSVPIGTIDKPKNHNSKRAENGTILQVLENMDFFYAAEIDFGTPPQTVVVLVDTGSNELWVNPDCSTAPSLDQEAQCNSFGEYDPRKSNTPPIGPFGSETINYGDASDPTTQTSATIRYYTETLGFGGANITNQTFGVVVTSDGISQGIMGLSPDLRGGFDSDEPYSLVLTSMADQGLIASRAFSLDLRHSEATTGAVIYGGLDRNKFIGSLEKRPIIRGEAGEFRLAVTLTSLGVTFEQSEDFGVDEEDSNVMLDSGTTITRMHYSAAYPILEALDAEDDGEGYYITRCSYRNRPGSVDFGFGPKIVRVPFSDFILDVGSATWCYIGLVVTTDQQILGDSVLRAGYFVFDWDNEEVHVAQAANCGENDIVTIGSGTSAVPDVTGNCQESDVTAAPSTTDSSDSETSAISNTVGLPTQAFTTTYTITSCPFQDSGCTVGAVTTQTYGGAGRPTVTVTAGADSNSDEDSGAWCNMPISWVFVAMGAFAVGCNMV
ncbi:aspartic peptidase domain-containing protein [Dactylonectria macrodidyma]|uniref:Aspartic peptidase domain-containing protein n=1 Tax=Dactylonectria macrodidyma TaxID=307937 RepID=A0A9P9FW27_9HYPO|nr:aspartic peptidase domain-containing protein [Dactylonectria macrodidyma]